MKSIALAISTMMLGVGLHAATACATARTTTTSCCPSVTNQSKQVKKMTGRVKNEEFYKVVEGKKVFDSEKATQAYFNLIRGFGLPVYERFTTDPGFFWAIDFGQGEFASYGMAGVIWCNELPESYFGHTIYLLPCQSIPEHSHVTTTVKGKKHPAKHESWQVTHGSVYSFSEIGEPNLDQFPEVKALLAPEQVKHLKSKHVEKWEADGKVYKLAKTESWHFLMGGPEGAVVSEFATYHDNEGLRFSNPKVKF